MLTKHLEHFFRRVAYHRADLNWDKISNAVVSCYASNLDNLMSDNFLALIDKLNAQ
jgi:hypothetical protein